MRAAAAHLLLLLLGDTAKLKPLKLLLLLP
jgi:hypothetical protein